MPTAKVHQDTINLIQSRRSIRGYLPQAVDQTMLENIFNIAQTAPSSCNTQPWKVGVVSGAARDRVRNKLEAAVMSGDFQMDFSFDGSYSGVYKERQHDAAAKLYTAMGIERGEKDKRDAAFMRNFAFFDAPHVAFLFLPEEFGVREAADLGMYAQNLMLSIQAHGLSSCSMTALSFNAPVVREELGLDESYKLMFGIVFGYEDTEHAANSARIGRATLEDTVVFAQ
ncbi:MAG: nitroreductase family protein [Sinobacterium sp.]|nr:nitroreductase family protein [Sinobacterium sp.]